MANFNPNIQKKSILPSGPIRFVVGFSVLLLLVSTLMSSGKEGGIVSLVSSLGENKFKDSNITSSDGAATPRDLPEHIDFKEIPDIYDAVLDDYNFPEQVADLSLEASTYYYILAQLTTKSDAHWRAESLKAPEEIHYNDFMFQPEKYRGTVVTIRGQIRTIWKQELPAHNPSKLEYNYQGQILDMDGNLYSFQTLDPLDVKVDDVVVLTGIFMKRWCYVNRDNRWTWTPLVFSRQLNKISAPDVTAESYIEYVMIILIVCVSMWAFINMRGTKTSDKAFREFVYSKRGRRKVDPSKVAAHTRKRLGKSKKTSEQHDSDTNDKDRDNEDTGESTRS